MNRDYMKFSNAEPQGSYEIIPEKTLAKVRLKIKGGGHDDPSQGWVGGWATKSDNTDAIYLRCEFTVIGGKYDGRKVWSLIGLHSEKTPEYCKIGRSFIRSIIDSAHGFDSEDKTEVANNTRDIKGFGDLEGIEFVARIDVTQDKNGNDRNEIRVAITKGHKEYDRLMDLNGRHKLESKKKGIEGNSELKNDEIPF